MANSGFQKTVAAPNLRYPGDAVGVQATIQAKAMGFISSGELGVGTFVWGINGTNQVVQAKGSNTQLAGFVWRSQSNAFRWADFTQGNSMTIPDQAVVSILPSGQVTTVCVSLAGGGTINVGDAVYVNNTTGVVTVGVTSEPGYTQTNWIVVNNNVFNTLGLVLVDISNENQFLGV